MKFPPRLIIASHTTDLPDHLASRGYALIHAHTGLPDPTHTLAQAKAWASDILARSDTPLRPVLPFSMGTVLEQQRPFAPNKSTLRPAHAHALVARAFAELTAVALILHGHERIRMGPHCIVLAACTLSGGPDTPIQELTGTPQPAKPAIAAFVAIQPDSGSGESFDETIAHPPSPLWPAIDPRLDEMLEHWSIQPRTPRHPPYPNAL